MTGDDLYPVRDDDDSFIDPEPLSDAPPEPVATDGPFRGATKSQVLKMFGFRPDGTKDPDAVIVTRLPPGARK